jgi:hypothetical protein
MRLLVEISISGYKAVYGQLFPSMEFWDTPWLEIKINGQKLLVRRHSLFE